MITLIWIGIIGGALGFYVSGKKTYEGDDEAMKELFAKRQLEAGNTIWIITGVIIVIAWLIQNVSIKGFND